MARSIILNINGVPTKCKDLDWDTLEDRWIVIKLEDGTICKLKMVPTQIIRVGDTLNDLGIPQYQVLSQNIFVPLIPVKDALDHDDIEATRV